MLPTRADTHNKPMDPLALLRSLVALPGPPGQEDLVRDFLDARCWEMGYAPETDPKGNLIVKLGSEPKIVVTAHMDEIALMVTQVLTDGSLSVSPMGGLSPWKLGEGLVTILADEPLNGALGFGSVHTEDGGARSVQAKDNLSWELAEVATGLSAEAVVEAGVAPGTRVVSAQREVHEIGELIASRFLDDRADCVSWLLALSELKGKDLPVWFAATVSEEVGGEGAQYLMHKVQPDICIALELGPNVPDAPVDLDSTPTLWVSDSYAAMKPSDVALVRSLGAVQLQALSRGGSDASCAASRGLCARPITLGLPMENSHGFEVMHPDAIAELAELTVSLVLALT